MQYIADLEIHSKYSRAVSPNSNLENHEIWAAKKGIDIVGTGDFTHPAWLRELRDKLVEDKQARGLYILKNSQTAGKIKFLLSAEVSCIWSQAGRVRRVHILLYAPSFEAVQEINNHLEAAGGKLSADGRPILGLTAEKLAELVFRASPQALIIPAHCWTPWFGMYGSKSGFDSLNECFGEFSYQIYGVETGLSSDPPMNWRLKELDDKAIVSFSDAHSPQNLGREATVFELADLSYENIYQTIRDGAKLADQASNYIAFTIEFFPQEGKYHFDGHRECGISFSPQETKRHKGLCPKCKKPLTVGVLNRVEELADRPLNYQAPQRPPYKSLVPLTELIAESLGVASKTSKKVLAEYERLVQQGQNEFNILINLSDKELGKIADKELTAAILNVRKGQVKIQPGYDGVYGQVVVLAQDKSGQQPALF